MCDSSLSEWGRWRITLAEPISAAVGPGRWPAPQGVSPAESAGPTRPEPPGPEGIRHELVERVRREIAAGTYDTEEKWLAAVNALLRRIGAAG